MQFNDYRRHDATALAALVKAGKTTPLDLLVTALSLCIGAMFGTKEAGFWVAWAGVMLYGESREVGRLASMLLIVCGIVGLKLTSRS